MSLPSLTLLLKERRSFKKRLTMVGRRISRIQGKPCVRENEDAALSLDEAFLLVCEMLSEITGDDYETLKEKL